MFRVAILSAMQQMAEALGTQFQSVYALYNDKRHICNLSERQSSDRVTYVPYSAIGTRNETVQLLRLIRQISPDLIYVNSLRHLLAVGAWIRRSAPWSSKPIVIAASHNSAVWQNPNRRLLVALLLRFLPEGILTLAEFQRKWLIQYGVSASKIRTIPNPVDIVRFSPGRSTAIADTRGAPVLINIADLRPIKNQEALIRVAGLLKGEFPEVRLILMGSRFSDSEYGRHLMGLISELHVEENVISIGDIPHERIPELLRSSDISVMASVSEVCPSAVLESLSVGRVMISTAVGGIPDLIIDGVNGFLVQPGDLRGYADLIARVLRHQDLRMCIEKNAREWAKAHYSFDVIGEKHREFVAALLRSSASRLHGPIGAN